MRKILIAAAAALLATTAACNSESETYNTSNTIITDYNTTDGTADEVRQEEVTVSEQ